MRPQPIGEIGGRAGRKLAAPEQVRLSELEQVIELGKRPFIEVGEALAEIRDGGLYRDSHATFEDYCRVRWDLSRKRAYDLTAAAEVAGGLSPIGDIATPANEAVARELTPLSGDEEAIIAAWREAQDDAKAHGTRITAKIVKNAVRGRVRRIGREAESEGPVWSRTLHPDLHAELKEVVGAEEVVREWREYVIEGVW